MLNNDPTYRLEEARRIVESRISSPTLLRRATPAGSACGSSARAAPTRRRGPRRLAAWNSSRRSGATPLVRRSCSTSTARSPRSRRIPTGPACRRATLQLLGTLAGALRSRRPASPAAPPSTRPALVPVDGLVDLRQPRPRDDDRRPRCTSCPTPAVWLPDGPPGAPASSCRSPPRRGGWVEDKGATLSIHYREAPDPDAAREAPGARGRAGRRARPGSSPGSAG